MTHILNMIEKMEKLVHFRTNFKLSQTCTRLTEDKYITLFSLSLYNLSLPFSSHSHVDHSRHSNPNLKLCQFSPPLSFWISFSISFAYCIVNSITKSRNCLIFSWTEKHRNTKRWQDVTIATLSMKKMKLIHLL